MKYLFCTSANYGYVYAALYLAHQLKQQGHEIYFLTGPDFTALLREQGFVNLLPNPNDYETFAVQYWAKPLGHIKTVQYLDKIYKEYHPEILVAGALSFSTTLFAKWYNLPNAVLGLATFTGQTNDNYRPQPLIDFFIQNVLPDIYKFLHLPIENILAEDLLGDIFLLRTIPHLENPLLPNNVHFIGDCLWEPTNLLQKNAELAQFLHTADNIIYIQHDNRFVDKSGKNQTSAIKTDFFHILFDWAKTRPVRLVVATRDKTLANQNWGDKVYIHTHIPRQEIMPYTHLTITNGSTGVVLASLTAGVPILFVNPHSEGIRLSQICTEAEVALSVNTDESLSLFAHQIDTLLNTPSFAQKAQQLQKEFEELNKQNLGAILLEQLAYQKKPITRSEKLLSV